MSSVSPTAPGPPCLTVSPQRCPLPLPPASRHVSSHPPEADFGAWFSPFYIPLLPQLPHPHPYIHLVVPQSKKRKKTSASIWNLRNANTEFPCLTQQCKELLLTNNEGFIISARPVCKPQTCFCAGFEQNMIRFMSNESIYFPPERKISREGIIQ